MIWHVARRELRVRLGTPWPWVVAATWLALQGLVFTLVLGVFVRAPLDAPDPTEAIPLISGYVEPLFSANCILLLLFVPLLTMGSLAGEQRSGSIALLLSAPISTLEVVLGKWLGLVAFVSLLLALGAVVPVGALLVFGSPPLGPLVSAAVGLWLLAGGLAALGLLASSLSSSQLVAAVMTWTTAMGSWLVAAAESGDGLLATVAVYGSLLVHARGFGQGLLDPADVAWFVGFGFVALVAAWQRLESWRWR
mgnify:CR=1 FL=1